MAEYAIEVQNLTKTYGRLRALDHVSFKVPKGPDIWLGRKKRRRQDNIDESLNESDQSERPGEITIFGQSTPQGLNKMRRRSGVMIEIPSFYPFLTARENLEYYRRQRGIAGKTCIDEVLEQVELTNTGNKKVLKNFSLGMKQRLGLALALMNHPGTADFR